MVVNDKANPIELIQDILKDQNGILLTSDLARFGIPRTYLSILLKKGEIQRVSRGVYSTKDQMNDEMANIQMRFKAAIFSHESALYLLGLTDRTPLFYSVTVPTGYNASSLKDSGAKVFFVNRNLYTIGLTIMKSPHGNDIQAYDLERTICDTLRSRNKMDIQLINEALKKYVVQQNRNINRLYEYASLFRIQKIAREYLEVLL